MTTTNTNILVITSSLFLVSGVYAFIHGVYAFTALSVITAAVSAVYWRNYTDDYMLTLDRIVSRISFSIVVITGYIYLNNIIEVVSVIIIFCSIVYSYLMSNHLYRNDEPQWIYYHALFHFLVALYSCIVVRGYVIFFNKFDVSASPPLLQ